MHVPEQLIHAKAMELLTAVVASVDTVGQCTPSVPQRTE